MEKIALLALMVSSIGFFTSAYAEEVKVELTSFRSAGVRTTAAELCGKVAGLTEASVVRVTIDEKTTRPGFYNAVVDQDGLFCLAVITYRGTAIASIKSLGRAYDSKPIQMSGVEVRR